MDKNYDHKKYEGEIYKKWEESDAFAPKTNKKKKTFSIIMPPPNANGELHLGHATFVAVSDILIRFHRMQGEPTLWLPGVDHAGILTQVTFEKKLKKEENKSRHDLGRAEFYRRCYEFAINSKKTMESQMKSLGVSADWSREKFTLDPEVSQLVAETFVKMYQENLIYRGFRIVNWCPRCRSTLSDLELEWQERQDPLYYIKYGPFVLATVRPETKFGDTAIAVHPQDPRYQKYIGQEVEVEGLLGKIKLKVIADEAVDREFGTGVIKVTPGHDPLDWEIGQRHSLEVKSVIDFDGRLTEISGSYQGLKVEEARLKVAADLQTKGLIEKTDLNYRHEVATCERCASVIEPLVSRQWFVKIKALAEPAIEAVEKKSVQIIPAKYETMYFNWMRGIRDWPISRQLWWGHQMPVWYARSQQKTAEQQKEFDLLAKGDTRARIDALESPIVSPNRPLGDDEYLQDPDTLDTWFSSGQWPVNTLKTAQESDFECFYPTTVMNTAYEILSLWVSRMIMFGLYLTGQVPFKFALINGVLRDEKGAKMSKSKGNGVNPNEAIDKYGADAVRFALVASRDNGNDILISKQQMEERIKGYRNFCNKIWNIARFVEMSTPVTTTPQSVLAPEDETIRTELAQVIDSVTVKVEQFKIGMAAEEIYEFVWHRFADWYIEAVKNRKQDAYPTLHFVLQESLKLLHPFMPFVTEAVWQELKLGDRLLIESDWPVSEKQSA